MLNKRGDPYKQGGWLYPQNGEAGNFFLLHKKVCQGTIIFCHILDVFEDYSILAEK